MFIEVDVSKATALIISVPVEKSTNALPAVTQMLEENALFLNVSTYPNSVEEVKPSMTVHLQNTYSGGTTSYGSEKAIEYTVTTSDCVIEGYEKSTPELHLNFDKERKGYQTEIDNLKSKLSILENEKKSLEEKLAELSECEE